MADTITGTRYAGGTSGITDARIVKDVGDILLLEPDNNPLTILSMKFNKEDALGSVFFWEEDERLPRWDAVTTGTSATDTTTLSVTYPGYFLPGDTIKIPRTGDIMRVTTITASLLTVVRLSGNNTLATSDPVLRIAPAIEQGGGPRGKASTKVATLTGTTQIIQKAYGTSKTLDATKLYGGGDLAHQKKKAELEIGEDMERMLLENALYRDVSGAQPLTLSAGLPGRITTNAVAVGGQLTQAKIDTALKGCVRYGHGIKSKVLVCGTNYVDGIHRLANDKLQMVPKDKTFGVTINALNTAYGYLKVIPHWLLDGDINAAKAYILDMKNIKYMNLRAMTHEDITSPGVSAKEYQYEVEMGWKIMQEKSHAVLTGCTG